MNFGLALITTQTPPDDSRSVRLKYRQTVDLVKIAEEEGFDSAWVSEHHGVADNYLSAVMPMSAALGEATSRITIGTAIALAPFYQPLRLAEDAAMLDVLTNGRFELGLGIGYRDAEFEQFRVPKSERVARLLDCIEVCRQAWTGEEFAFDGRRTGFDAAKVTPEPVQGTDLPIHIGGYAEPAVRRAANVADGLIAGAGIPFDGLRTQFDWLEDEGADFDEFSRYVLREGFLGDSKDDAWRRAKDSLLYTKRKYREWDNVTEVETDEEKWRSLTLHGTPAEMREQIEPYAEVLGEDDHLILRFENPGLDYDVQAEVLERFGKEVAPHFR